jgi:hypothetical protein
MGGIETFMWGVFGGAGAELTVLFGLRQQFPQKFPHWLRSRAYYVVAGLMALAGGAIALAYVRSGTPLTAILAIQVGASAPLFLRKARDVVAEPPERPDPAKID